MYGRIKRTFVSIPFTPKSCLKNFYTENKNAEERDHHNFDKVTEYVVKFSKITQSITVIIMFTLLNRNYLL